MNDKNNQVRPGSTAYYFWLGLLVLIALDIVWANCARISIVNWLLAISLVALFGVLWAVYGVTGRSAQIADIGQYISASLILSSSIAVLSYCTATLALPLRDADLVRWDAMLGFHWKSWFDRVLANNVLLHGLGYFYNSMILQIFLAIIYFSHFRRPDRNRELLWVLLLSGAITALVAGLLPARGAYDYFGVPQFASHLKELSILRQPGPHVFELAKMQGIITFPSFHTVVAISVPYAFRQLGWPFIMVTALNVIMLISIVSHGGHYLVDVISGAAVVLVSVVITNVVKKEVYK